MPENDMKRRIYIWIGLLCLCLIMPAFVFAGEMQNNQQHTECTLLLNSGLADCEEATVKYLVWTEDKENVSQIEKALQGTGLEWEKIVLKDFCGQQAVKYTTVVTLNKEKEDQAMAFYTALGKTIGNTFTHVFLEEQVNTVIDVRRYVKDNHVKMMQKAEISGLLSISGYHPQLPGTVNAGGDLINLQVITQEKNASGNGKTVLALPAILEEF